LTSNSGTDVEEEMADLSSPQVAVSSIEIVETPWGPRIRTRIVGRSIVGFVVGPKKYERTFTDRDRVL
jgi:hypothetical protein